MVKQYGTLYRETRKALLAAEDAQTASLMARSLVCSLSGKTTAQLLAEDTLYASEEICTRVETGTRRLLQGEPLAYVLGEWEFYGIPLYVTPDVLIPRDDTCAVVELAIRHGLFLGENPRILDLCCGSGCIGLAIASRIPDSRVTLADLSKEALTITRKNIARCKAGGRAICVSIDAMQKPAAFLGKFDMIVSNPPYITAAEMLELPASVREYEPHMALYGGEDGLDFYRAIAANYAAALKLGGYLAFEFGMGQGDAVCRILEERGYTVLERTKDYNDRERAVLAQYGRKES